MLDHLVVGDGVLAEQVGGDETHLMPEKGRTLLPQLGKHSVCQSFKSLHEPGWYAVPELGCSKVQVVDTVEIHILCMPGKCRLPTTKV